MPMTKKDRSAGARYDPVAAYRPVQFRCLDDEQISLLHDATLEILERTGARFFAGEALDLFRKGGAQVSDGNLVRIPRHLVEWALRTAPKSVTLYDRNGRRALTVGGYHTHFGAGSDCMHIYDLYDGRRRKAVLQDVVNGVRLVDALPNLAFVMSMFLPSDVPQDRYERHQMSVMLQETTKPIVFVGIEASSTAYAVEMASAVAGGLEELQRAPFIVNYVNAVSPLRHNEESVQRLLYAAERNMPSIYAPGRARGSLAPITVAGGIALGNAGFLAGVVLSQLKREGSPVIGRRPGGDALDMRSMTNLYASPDAGPFAWALAHHYGLPTFGEAGCSDAKIFDAQAAAEATLTLMDNILNGVNLGHDVGYLEDAMTGCLELVAFCDETIGWLRRYLRRLEITEETLALNLIHEIGPDGDFIQSRHTLQHVRDDWAPALADRSNYSKWMDNGGTTLQKRANAKAREIVEEHRAPRLPAQVVQRLEEVVQA